MARQRPQFSGFSDRVVKVKIYRHFTKPTRRQLAIPEFELKSNRAPLIVGAEAYTLRVNDPAPVGSTQSEIDALKREPATLEVAILPADTYQPNLQDLGLNVYFEYIAYPRFRWNGVTKTDIVVYENPANEETGLTELNIDRVVNDPAGFQAFFLNSLSKPY